jgi:23S rRNA (uracil1939-C5)-methyltransferase
MAENFRTILSIKKVGINGEGIGYYKRKAVFVPFALPGEKIVCEFVKEQKTYIEGKLIGVEKKSPHRVKAPCPYYEHCGGCQLQHLAYKEQLNMKKDLILQSLARYVEGYEKLGIDIKDTIGLEEPYYYRNRAQMPVSFDGEQLVTGLYEINSNNLVHIDTCMIQQVKIDNIIDRLKQLLMDAHIEAYNRRTRKGVLKHISVRFIDTTDQAQVVLVLENKSVNQVKMKQIADQVMNEFKEVKSFYLNINSDRNSHEIYGRDFVKIKGEDTIEAMIGDTKFDLSPSSFFQLNTRQTKVLYDIAKSVANLTPHDRVIDAYSGAGTIGQYVAKHVAEVRGVDTVKAAVEDARKNAELNGLDNTYYEVGAAEDIIPKWVNEGFKPTVLVMDPPRTGVDSKLLALLRKIKVKRVVYISCNPSTLAKDLNELRKTYNIKSIQPVDMFPQTSHVESVVLLVRK